MHLSKPVSVDAYKKFPQRTYTQSVNHMGLASGIMPQPTTKDSVVAPTALTLVTPFLSLPFPSLSLQHHGGSIR